MRNIFTTIALLSAERAELSKEENAKRTDQLRHRLAVNGHSFAEALGCYRGVNEVSFIIIIDSPETEVAVQNYAAWLGQECYAISDCERGLELVFSDGQRERLRGRLQSVTEARAKATGAYTQFNNQYYALVS